MEAVSFHLNFLRKCQLCWYFNLIVNCDYLYKYICLQFIIVKWKVKSLSRVQLFATPWMVADQAPPSMEFSRQEYWSGLPFPSPRIFPTRAWTGSPALQADTLPSELPGKLQPDYSEGQKHSFRIWHIIVTQWKPLYILWLGDDDDGGKDNWASWTLCPISALDCELPGADLTPPSALNRNWVLIRLPWELNQ